MKNIITVITATYNAAQFLPALITSLREQSCKDFDWIIADGLSTDETLNIIKNNSDIVKKLIPGPDFGIYHALNNAIKITTTPYYIIVGADDVLDKRAIELYLQAATLSQADIISANVATSDFGLLKPSRGQAWRFGHLAYVSQHAVGSLIRTSLHQKVGYYSKYYPIAADRFFILNAIENYDCVVYSANFTAGVYSCEGISSSRYYDTLLDIFKVDFALSKYPVRAALYALIKYIINIRRFR